MKKPLIDIWKRKDNSNGYFPNLLLSSLDEEEKELISSKKSPFNLPFYKPIQTNNVEQNNQIILNDLLLKLKQDLKPFQETNQVKIIIEFVKNVFSSKCNQNQIEIQLIYIYCLIIDMLIEENFSQLAIDLLKEIIITFKRKI
ncbi:hypothetical protein CROQUDRAFT_183163 [Cronartium quercuum f. sp. fusiforme G11]|uniref:Uncharacterized protein n=1 Tax=Cronartium quercuum f. sp. fusiforme G11 TaxID=708437 RepID=A0A9P6NH07_9BASI|nr:hypothetical protein CROQUDRAFT_183163 [Cronartium quercuum f. sp. fusiforme G11]